jgi:hypothetical protein
MLKPLKHQGKEAFGKGFGATFAYMPVADLEHFRFGSALG